MDAIRDINRLKKRRSLGRATAEDTVQRLIGDQNRVCGDEQACCGFISATCEENRNCDKAQGGAGRYAE
ncbi:hypothetical protein DZS_36100 [Dickeya ananatis]